MRRKYALTFRGRDRFACVRTEERPIADGPGPAARIAGSGRTGMASASGDELDAIGTLVEVMGIRGSALVMHGESVGRLAAATAVELGLPPTEVGRLRLAGVLHDVGKIAVPEAILDKAGPLDPLEWAQIRRHPEVGYRLVRDLGLPEIAGWILCHHERPDGLGYPFGLSGARIPIQGAILAAADAYDAMVAERPYQAALPHAHACLELRVGSGSQFEPAVVEALIAVLEQGRVQPKEEEYARPRDVS